MFRIGGLICSLLASYIDRIFNVSSAHPWFVDRGAWGYEVNQKESRDSLGLWFWPWIIVNRRPCLGIQKSRIYLHGEVNKFHPCFRYYLLARAMIILDTEMRLSIIKTQ